MTTQDAPNQKTLYIIHHSHTDIGYTELQSRITRWHVDFIRQALEIIDATDARRSSDFDGFKWVCESFWAVERFLERATNDERDAFVRAVQSGDIGLSASYLNFTELPDRILLDRAVRRVRDFGQSIDTKVDCAMTADVNGYSWGFSQALHDNGVYNLFTCIHTHHGMYPLGKTQVPFFWETPRGDRILVWNGEHYHYGNELGVVPNAVSSYLTKDECDADMIFHDHWRVAETRIPRYFESLAARGYPFDFVPVMASGLRTDNAPPSGQIADFIERWNEKHGGRYRVEMTTLDAFFRTLRESTDGRLHSEVVDIPVYRGDWPDWWSDGAASAPGATRMFRQAQRNLEYYNDLINRYPDLTRLSTDEIEYNLMLYAEHTFGHSDAMAKPWHPLTQTISARKKGFAAAAADEMEGAIDDAHEQLGGTTLRSGMPLRYTVVNPHASEIRGIARLGVSHFEYHELALDRGARVFDVVSGEELSSQLEMVPRGCEYAVHVTVLNGEQRDLEIVPAGDTPSAYPRAAFGRASETGEGHLESEFARIDWRPGIGIMSWRDKMGDRELVRRDAPHAAFTPVYEVTPVPGTKHICSARGAMGLNRKGENVVRTAGRLRGVGRVESGPVFAVAELEYDVPGMSHCTVEFRLYGAEPRADVAVRFNKESAWEPENVYIPLPFSPLAARARAAGAPASGYEIWLDKAGAAVRPRKDQIPGTLTDYYSVQNGLVLAAGDCAIILATPDTHLVQLGDLEYLSERPLAGDPELDGGEPFVYAWLMTNYWETNFDASLGGFYEFRYSILWFPASDDPAAALERCRNTNHGIRCFRVKDTL